MVPGSGMTFAKEAGPRRNAAAPPSPAAAGGWVAVGAGGQDALDGPVGRVPGGDRPRAGGFQPGRVMPVSQADHALGGAQPAERVLGEQSPMTCSHASPMPAAWRRHQAGVRMWNAIFSGG